MARWDAREGVVWVSARAWARAEEWSELGAWRGPHVRRASSDEVNRGKCSGRRRDAARIFYFRGEVVVPCHCGYAGNDAGRVQSEPGGSAPLAMCQVYGGVPPEARSCAV